MSETPESKDKERPQPQTETKHASRRPWVVVLVVLAVVLGVFGFKNGWIQTPVGDGEPVTGEEVKDNQQPQVVSVEAADDRIEPGAPTNVLCHASDPDGDILAYTWSASDGEVAGTGSQVTWVSPDTEGLYRIFVTVDDGRGGVAQASLTLSVRSNQPPEILVMQSEVGDSDAWVVPGASVYVQCEAQDPDGDQVTFTWSATGGKVFGQGSAVVWEMPAPLGMYWITAVVEDTYGATAERSIPVTVSAAEPPPLQGLTASALDTDLFRPYGDSWRIFKERSCTIEAQIDDPDGIYTYDWLAEHGTLVADGATAVWTAPVSPKGWVSIVLVVSDSHGNEASEAIRIYVETCSSCM